MAGAGRVSQWRRMAADDQFLLAEGNALPASLLLLYEPDTDFFFQHQAARNHQDLFDHGNDDRVARAANGRRTGYLFADGPAFDLYVFAREQLIDQLLTLARYSGDSHTAGDNSLLANLNLFLMERKHNLSLVVLCRWFPCHWRTNSG